jgi:arsenate reductase
MLGSECFKQQIITQSLNDYSPEQESIKIITFLSRKMTTATIYHNPRCSKSRKTLELLEQNQVNIEVVKYLETPPTSDELKHILSLLNKTPDEVMRKNEDEYKLHFKNKTLTESEKIDLMNQFPKVIERPIVVMGNKAVIGRPPENVLDIL